MRRRRTRAEVGRTSIKGIRRILCRKIESFRMSVYFDPVGSASDRGASSSLRPRGSRPITFLQLLSSQSIIRWMAAIASLPSFGPEIVRGGPILASVMASPAGGFDIVAKRAEDAALRLVFAKMRCGLTSQFRKQECDARFAILGTDYAPLHGK